MARSAEDIRTRLQNIDPYDFEDFVADLWEDRGWETTVAQDSNDMGVDVVARKSTDLVEQKLVIQAKRYSDGNKIGRPKVQQYHSLKEQDAAADAAVVVTTSSFSKQAEEWAEKHNVKLIDGDDLLEIIEERRRYDLVDQYAPRLEPETTNADSDNGGAEPIDPYDQDAMVEPKPEHLPEPFDDSETRLKFTLGGGAAGLLLVLNPTGISFPVELIGVCLLIGAVVLFVAPAKIADAVTSDVAVHKRFSTGGAVINENGIVKYQQQSESEPVVFDEADDQSRNRVRANVYGTLKANNGGSIEWMENGIPTKIASQGQPMVVAYRFAVHKEDTPTIAKEMDLPQDEVVQSIKTVVRQNS
ncbi:restriction endonuclease [Halosimplex sp. TS25]|uniref:restriction endonuclease n=1 Tax=Halosimplex rarum TaxID=3396619 RepID=UPI0039E78F74